MILLMVLLASSLESASSVAAYATLEPPEIPFYQTACYTRVIEIPPGIEVPMLPVLDGPIEGLEIRPGPLSWEALADGGRRIRQAYVLDPVAVQTYILPPFEVILGNGEKAEAPEIALQVRDVSPEEEEELQRFEEIVGPLAVVPRARAWGAIAGAIAAALLLMLGVAAYLARRRTKQANAPPPPTPWETALRQLQELERRRWPAAGKCDPYYIALSDIVRQYIEDRFALRAPEQTTPEFLAAASESGLLSDDHQRFLAGFLRHCDRVKFARHAPSHAEMEAGLSAVRRFVEETVPTPPAESRETPEMQSLAGNGP